MGLGVRLALVLVLVAGCDDYVLFGPPTETVCPTDSTLTYENFGKEFMEDYCTRCHHSELVGADRHGAPSFHDFDTVFGIRAVSNHVDETTAAGPASINEGMPRGAPYPTLDERYLLGEWVACGMPSTENP